MLLVQIRLMKNNDEAELCRRIWLRKGKIRFHLQLNLLKSFDLRGLSRPQLQSTEALLVHEPLIRATKKRYLTLWWTTRVGLCKGLLDRVVSCKTWLTESIKLAKSAVSQRRLLIVTPWTWVRTCWAQWSAITQRAWNRSNLASLKV